MTQKKMQHNYEFNTFLINLLYLQIDVVSQSRTGLQIYEGHDDQLNRPGPIA
jgi:hypothetical protein